MDRRIFDDLKKAGIEVFFTDETDAKRAFIGLLKKHKFKKIVAYQTLFQPLEKIKEIERPKEDFAKGVFVVICGKKI